MTWTQDELEGFEVLLDGEPVDHVTSANPQQGWLTVHAPGEIAMGGRPRRINGRVELVHQQSGRVVRRTS